jgi:hypothetical protein
MLVPLPATWPTSRIPRFCASGSLQVCPTEGRIRHLSLSFSRPALSRFNQATRKQEIPVAVLRATQLVINHSPSRPSASGRLLAVGGIAPGPDWSGNSGVPVAAQKRPLWVVFFFWLKGISVSYPHWWKIDGIQAVAGRARLFRNSYLKESRPATIPFKTVRTPKTGCGLRLACWENAIRSARYSPLRQFAARLPDGVVTRETAKIERAFQ